MVKTRQSILASYQEKVKLQETVITSLKDKSNKVSLSRLAAFIAEILVVALIISEGFHWALGGLLVIPIIVFLYLVRKQSLLLEALNYAEKLHFVFENEVQLILTGKQKYNNGSSYASEIHPYSSDLDIYGPGSLYALLNRSNTLRGMDLLAKQLGRSYRWSQPSTLPA
ncbi:MAG: hypothetical protein EOO89_14920 [Pedobacter sp.]|nr:MAG: hypothetical protein EOO89_14920 [Pedobacter sp.]